jgi:outer membrane protein assembly factor BamB
MPRVILTSSRSTLQRGRRRTPLRALALAFPAFASLLILPRCASAADGDWPQWRGPGRDNVWPCRDFPQKLPARLPQLWRQPIGGGYGGIAAAGGRVFVMDRQKTPRDVERVVCFDLDTGARNWVHEYPVSYKAIDYGNGPRSTPTVIDGKVYTLGAVGHVHCLDAETGKVLWARDCVKEFKARLPTWGLACSPLVDGDRVIVQVGGEHACVVALERLTGKVVWQALQDRAGYASPVRIDVGASKLLVMWTAENVNALDAATGKLLWSVPFQITYDVAIADPVWHDGILFCGQYWEGSLALRLDANGLKPEKAWDGKRLRLLMATPLVRDGHAYCLDRERGLNCVELKSGTIRWRDFRISYDRHNPHSAPVWTGDGRALFLNEKGELILARLAPEKFEELGRLKIFGGSWAHPALTRDRILMRDDSQIVCVKLRE